MKKIFLFGLLALGAFGFSAFRSLESLETQISKEPTLPDLVIGGMKMVGKVDRVFVFKVKNIGKAKSFSTNVCVKPLGTPTQQCLGITVFTVLPISPGKERTYKIIFKPASSGCDGTQSLLEMDVCVDIENYVVESDETNNQVVYNGKENQLKLSNPQTDFEIYPNPATETVEIVSMNRDEETVAGQTIANSCWQKWQPRTRRSEKQKDCFL